MFSAAAQGWPVCPKSHRVPTDPAGTLALLTAPALSMTHPRLLMYFALPAVPGLTPAVAWLYWAKASGHPGQ